jgi:hypothetical protein
MKKNEAAKRGQVAIDPRAFPNLVPVHIPQRNWNTGIVPGLFRKIKLRQIAEEARLNADIAQEQSRMVDANCHMVTAITTLSAGIDLQLHQIAAQKQATSEYLVKINLENQLLNYQVEQERIAAETAKRNFKETYPDGPSETEDR